MTKVLWRYTTVVRFISIAFVVVKLKIFKFAYRFSINGFFGRGAGDVWSFLLLLKQKAVNSGLLNTQNIWSHHLPILRLLLPNDVSEKFPPQFSSLAAFLGATSFLKKKKKKNWRISLCETKLFPTCDTICYMFLANSIKLPVFAIKTLLIIN